MLTSHICGMDIGSSKISAALAVVKNGRINNLFFESAQSRGIKNGVIVDPASLMESLSKILKALKKRSGFKIRFVYTNLSGRDIITKHSHAIIPLAERGNKVIMSSDLNRVNEQAFVLGSNIDEEVVHKIPFSYTVDNKSNITNPLGLYGHRLEVDLFLVCAKLSTVQTLVHVLNQAGYEVRDLFFTGLATTRAIANRDFNDGINIICDIGSQVTELLIFQNGILRNIEVMSFAGDTITGALSEELNLPLDLAEEIKIGYGVVGENIGISDEKEVLLRKEAFYKPIKQRVICDIITRQARAMAKEIRARVEKQTALVEVKNILVCGRASLQEGFLELLETELSVRVKLARINNPELAGLFNRFEVLAGNKYISYISCLGIICQAILPQEAVFSKTKILEPNPVKKLLSKLEGLYHEYF